MKTRTSRISWLRGRNRQWRAYGRVCVTLRSAWFKAFKRALCATLTNRNYPVTPLSLAWFFQFLSRFYTLSCTRMCKKIYPVYLFPRALVFIDREGKMNKIKLKLSCIYIIGLLSNRIQRCLGCIIMWN